MDLNRHELELKIGKLRSERTTLTALKATARTIPPDIKHLRKTIARLEDQYRSLSHGRDPEEIKAEIRDLQADIETFAVLKGNIVVASVMAAEKIREHEIVIADRAYLLNKKQIALINAESTARQKRFTGEELRRVKVRFEEAQASPPKHELDPEEIEKQLLVIDVRIGNIENLLGQTQRTR